MLRRRAGWDHSRTESLGECGQHTRLDKDQGKVASYASEPSTSRTTSVKVSIRSCIFDFFLSLCLLSFGAPQLYVVVVK